MTAIPLYVRRDQLAKRVFDIIAANANIAYNSSTKKIEITFPAGGASSWAALTGKPTTVSGFGITDAVTDGELTAALADYLAKSSPTKTIKGRTAAGTGDATDLTVDQVLTMLGLPTSSSPLIEVGTGLIDPDLLPTFDLADYINTTYFAVDGSNLLVLSAAYLAAAMDLASAQTVAGVKRFTNVIRADTGLVTASGGPGTYPQTSVLTNSFAVAASTALLSFLFGDKLSFFQNSGGTNRLDIIVATLTGIRTVTWPDLSGTVTVSGNSTSALITGTGGNGFIELLTQSSDPSAPASGTRLFSNSNSKFSWRGSANTFVKTFDGAAATADRVYSLPDLAGTVLLDKTPGAVRQLLVSNTQLNNTGSTTENTIFTGTIPANSIGPNGMLEIIVMLSCNNSAGTKVFKFKINGTPIAQTSLTTTVNQRSYFTMQNRNSLTSQLFPNLGSSISTTFTNTTSANGTSAVDFGAAVTFTVTVQNSVSGDNGALETMSVRGTF